MKEYVLNKYRTFLLTNDKKIFVKKINMSQNDFINMIDNERFILNILKEYDNFPKIYSLNLLNKIIAYEYIEGIELCNIGVVSTESAIKLVIEIIKILEIIHSQSIVHCDLKPSNIIVGKDKVYLIDFGISQYKSENKFRGYGSIRYCSPEQYNKGKIDSRCDVYSMGIILYELITGRKMFDRESKNVIIKNKLGDKLPKISEYIINSPIELDDIFAKATKLKKEDRYSKIEFMRYDLEYVLKKYYGGKDYE